MAVKNTDRMLDLSRDLLASGVPKYGVGGRRNLIINGAMQVAQRGTSETGITTTDYYTADRYNIQINGLGTWTQSVEDDGPNGFSKSLKMLCTTEDASPAANDFMLLSYMFEGQDLQHLKKGTSSAESVTLSFWVKSNKTGTYTAEMMDNDNSLRHIAKSFTVNSSGTWEYKTITFEGDTTGALDNDNQRSLYLSFWLGAGSDFTGGTLQTSWGSYVAANRAVGNVNLADTIGNYFQITGVQLELGDTATPFEHRSYGEELALCQRYYCETRASIRGVAYAVNFFENQIYWPQEMRATPTTTLPSTTGDNINALVVATPTKYGARFSLQPTATGGFYALSKEIQADAEL